MCDLYICRICLIHGVRGEKMTKTLKLYYEELTNTIISVQDELPKWLCFECTSLLRKYHKFRDKCCNGQRLLGKILWKGQITFEAVDLIDRYNEKLNSSLSYPTTNNHIKTYTAKHKKDRTNTKSFKLEKIGNERDENEIKKENYKTPIIEAVFIDKNHITLEEKLFETIIPVENDIEVIKTNTNAVIAIEDDKSINVTDNDQIINIDNHDNDIDVHHNDIDNHDNGADNDNFIDNAISSDDENIFLDIVKKAVSGENKLVFIEDLKKKSHKNKRKTRKSKAKLLKSKTKLLKSKTKLLKSSTKLLKSEVKELRFTKQKKEYLVPEFWEQFKLSEEEAIAEFKKKEFSSKYVNAKFKCNKCLKGFSKWDILDRHTKLQHHESRGPLECRFCHMRFRIKCMLGKHMSNHYTIYNCLRCNMRFTNINSATLHDEYHNGVIRKCKYCGQTFAHNSTYYTHIRMNHRSEHLCTLCGASFVSEAGIAQHKRIKHVDDNTEVGPDSSDNYCDKCDVTFLTRAAFDAHFINSMMHAGEHKDKRKKRNFRMGDGGRKANVPTTCKLCGKHFLTVRSCLMHHKTEHPRQSRYLTHERHICEICGASLAPMSIASHMNTHTRAVVYPCDVCGMQFTSKSSHQRHQITHTGERPHPCPLCDKRFTQKNSMKLHYRTFHLKQPYPKRNRRKKTDEIPLVESFRDDTEPPPPVARWR